MSRLLGCFFLLALAPGQALAQQAYGPSDNPAENGEGTPVPLEDAALCDEQVREDGAIVVCRELPDSERYMSPLPRPVESDRTIIPGVTSQPCWVTNPELEGTLACMRVGSVPEYPVLIDLTKFPEPLTEEEEAAVSAIAPENAPPRPRVGERVPIDLSED
jgi:hypothetical protein